MARVTVEDCVDKVENRFELVMLTAQRARKIGSGSPLLVERDNDKNSVVALREVAAEKLNLEDIKEDLTKSHQRVIVQEEDDDGAIDLMDGEKEWGEMAEAAEASGMYADDGMIEDEDDDSEPSLTDLAGGEPLE